MPSIQFKLVEDGVLVRDLKMIENCINRYKRPKNGPATISIEEFHMLCKANSAVPSDPDEGYVLAHKTNNPFDFDSASVRAVITSPKMLSVLGRVKHLCVDTTYKLNWSKRF